MHHIIELILKYTGSNNTSGVYYGFWSGFGSDIAELGLLGIFYKKFVCHMHGCFRIGHHELPYGTFVYCKKHYREVVKKQKQRRLNQFMIDDDIFA